MNAVDTNVLVYGCDRSDPVKQAKARQVISNAAGGVLPWQVACEFIAVSRKLESQGFTPRDAWEQLDQLLRLFRLTLPSAAVLEHARTLHADLKWSFWDAVLVAACREAGVTRLYSEDLPAQAPPAGLEIVNPFK